MKTTSIKTVFVIAMLATGSAIALAAGSRNFADDDRIVKNETTDISIADKNKPQKIYAWIKKKVRCPEFINSEDDNLVEVWLKHGTNGRIEILKMNAVSDRLSSYVMQELNGQYCPVEDIDSIYHFAIQFKRIG